MAELRTADLRALLDLAGTLRAVADPEHLGAAALEPLRRLVPSDSISYNQIGTRRRPPTWAVDPPDALDDAPAEAFARYVFQHPVVRYSRLSGDGRAHTISDFLSGRQFHRTDLYATFFRPARVEHQVAITFAYAPSFIVGLALNRDAQDFSGRDRAVLDLARVQLMACYRAVTTAQDDASLLRAMDQALDEHRRGVLVVRPDGRLVLASPAALRLLRTHLGLPLVVGQRLPGRLRALIAANPARRPTLTLNGDDARLHFRLLAHPDPERRAVVVEERRPGQAAPLAAGGLSARERQILEMLADGHANGEIARRLQISIRTVHKHLEHLYTKLDVHDRTSAATRWLAERTDTVLPTPDG